MDTAIIPKIGSGIVDVFRAIFSFINDFIFKTTGDYGELAVLILGIILAYVLGKYVFPKIKSTWLVYLILGFIMYLLIRFAGGQT